MDLSKIVLGNFMAGTFVAMPFGVILDLANIVNPIGLDLIEFSLFWGMTWGLFVTGVALNRKYEFINLDGLFRVLEQITNMDLTPNNEQKKFFPIYIVGWERWG